MRLFRIAPKKFGADLTGAGARLVGGRWTPKGVPAVYTSESAPLAALETLVHQPVDMVPNRIVLMEIELPDDAGVEVVELSRLERAWNIYPFGTATVKTGEAWVKDGRTVALKVPSAIMPYGRGWNFVLNPMHPEFSRVKVIGLEPFTFERRLLKR